MHRLHTYPDVQVMFRRLAIAMLVGVFAAYLIVALLVLIAPPFKPKRRDLFGR